VNAHTSNEPPLEAAAGPVLPRRRLTDSADLDITPMIDIVFLLLIFFLVASIPDTDTTPDLAPARHGKGVDPASTVVITVADRGGPGPAYVYLGDGKGGTPLPDDVQQQKELVRAAVEDGFRKQGKSSVLVKAERRVPAGEVNRVSTAVAEADVEGIQMYYAVLEIQ